MDGAGRDIRCNKSEENRYIVNDFTYRWNIKKLKKGSGKRQNLHNDHILSHPLGNGEEKESKQGR